MREFQLAELIHAIHLSYSLIWMRSKEEGGTSSRTIYTTHRIGLFRLRFINVRFFFTRSSCACAFRGRDANATEEITTIYVESFTLLFFLLLLLLRVRSSFF